MKVWATRDTESPYCRLWFFKPEDSGGQGQHRWVPEWGAPGSCTVMLADFKKDLGCLPRCDRPMVLELVALKRTKR